MNRDTEIIREFLLSLIQDPDSTGASPSGTFRSAQRSSLETDAEAYPTDLLRESWDPIASEPSVFADLESELRDQDPNVNPVTPLGDVSAVQNRFQALLKNRLRSEIERHPPLFPWEKTAQDYPDVVPGEHAADVWVQQLRELSIPTVLPDDVLSALLDQCQQVMHQSLKSGIQLIKAVEGLFPEQPQTLQSVAQVVLQPNYRSSDASKTLEIDYAQANSQQQVALTMMAAQEILAALSLSVSPDVPSRRQEWLTATGLMQLQLQLNPSQNQLEIRVMLPAAGHLQLLDAEVATRSERHQSGELLLILDSPQPGYPYRLQVGLMGSAQPLQFVVQTLDSAELA